MYHHPVRRLYPRPIRFRQIRLLQAHLLKAPDTYASIIQVVINPVINLYLDEGNVVLAVEYVNTDAESAYVHIEKELVGVALDASVKKIIDTASANGYLSAEKSPAVTLDVVECKSTVERKIDVICEAEAAVSQRLSDSNISADVSVKDGGVAVDGETLKKAKEEYAQRRAEVEQVAEQAKKDKVNPKKNLKFDTLYISVEKSTLPEAQYLFTLITFKENGEYVYSMGDYSTENLYEDNDPVTYKGKKYYNCSGLGGGGEYTLTDTQIKLETDGVILEMDAGRFVIKSSDNERAFTVGKAFAVAK